MVSGNVKLMNELERSKVADPASAGVVGVRAATGEAGDDALAGTIESVCGSHGISP
jgi:hypothetical protein